VTAGGAAPAPPPDELLNATLAVAATMAAVSLPSLTLSHAASGASLTVFPFGATITSWRAAGGREVLFTSSRASFDGSRPIRGGIPLAFPQFAAQGPLPMHGFARTCTWAVASSGDGFVELALRDDAATRAAWPHAFALAYRVDFDGASLRTALAVDNTGDAPFPFEALQHTYVRGGAGAVAAGGGGTLAVAGLRGARFFAKTLGAEATQEEEELRFGEETDRIYLAPGAGAVEVRGVAGGATVVVTREGRLGAAPPAPSGADARVPLDVVVWNPGAVRAAAIADLGPEDWREFVCVEPGRVSGATAELGVLPPGKRFTLTQILEVRV
jgi:glucose-6-phosphate 1-epimerase